MAEQTVETYIHALPEERKTAVLALRTILQKQLPKGFQETMAYGMIAYVVPHHLYPKGYHADPQQPLPFIQLASQKSHIALYHMGIYADEQLLKWFTEAYPKHSKTKLDMGKSCIRFKNPAHIPLDLLSELCGKMTVDQWIKRYEQAVKK